MGRLKPGVTIDQANTEFIGLARRLSQDSPKTNQALVSASVRPLLHALTGVQLRQQAWGMLAAVILVLLIACVNVMNMQFGRVTLRAKEVAIRGALGATHWRIVRQMLTESLVVASFGAIAGVVIAYWAVDMFVQATNGLPFPLPYWIQFKIDGPVFAFTVGVTLLATIVSGLVPAWLSARGNAAEIMKEGGRGNTNRLVNAITAYFGRGANCADCCALHFSHAPNQIDPKPDFISITVTTRKPFTRRAHGLMEGAYPTEDARREFFNRPLRALRANPQFDSAALSSRFRMTFDGQGQYEVDGRKYISPTAIGRSETSNPSRTIISRRSD